MEGQRGTYSSISRVVDTLNGASVVGEGVQFLADLGADDAAHVTHLGGSAGEDEGDLFAAVVVGDVV